MGQAKPKNSVWFSSNAGDDLEVVEITVKVNGDICVYSDEPFSFSALKKAIEEELDSPKYVRCKKCGAVAYLYIGDRSKRDSLCDECHVKEIHKNCNYWICEGQYNERKEVSCSKSRK